MKTILITGSLGLVGSACVDLFLEEGWQVIGIDNNARSRFFKTERRMPSFRKNEEHFPVDIRDEGQVFKLFHDTPHIDAIIHTAAQPSHDYATEHVIEDFTINALGTVTLLEAARKYCPGAPFVFVSTDKVYGENMIAPSVEEFETRYGYTDTRGFDEDLGLDFAGDRSFFGCSKAAADMYAQEYAVRFGMPVGIFRPGCITGKQHRGAEQHGFLAYLAQCIKQGKTYNIYGFKGKQVRDQIHAHDAATAFKAFIDNPKAGKVYNLGGGSERSVSVLEAIKLLEEATGKEAKVVLFEERKGDRIWDVHDMSAFRKDYPNWDYTYSLEDIIKDLI